LIFEGAIVLVSVLVLSAPAMRRSSSDRHGRSAASME
jgi:hypothetical protein